MFLKAKRANLVTLKRGLWMSNTNVVLLGKAVECCTLDGESLVAESDISLCSNSSTWARGIPLNNKGHLPTLGFSIRMLVFLVYMLCPISRFISKLSLQDCE